MKLIIKKSQHMKDIIYELAFLISGELDEAKAQETAKKIESIVGVTGQIQKTQEPKKFKLAYPIKKQQEGFLASFDFTGEPKNIITISKSLEKEVDILRFLIIKKSPEKPKEEKPESRIKEAVFEEKPKVKAETPKKERVKKEKPSEEEKKEDLKKIEQDLDEILGQ